VTGNTMEGTVADGAAKTNWRATRGGK